MWRVAFILSLTQFRQRYSERRLRAAWLVLNPLVYTLLLTLIVSRVVRSDAEGLPYPVFCLSGLIPWLFFSAAARSACHSLVLNRPLVTRLQIPRIAIPVSASAVHGADLGVSLAILALWTKAYGLVWHLSLPALGALMLILWLTSTGLGLALSISNAYVRDTENVLPVLTQAWFFISPVFYSASQIPPSWKTLYFLNPIAVASHGLRASLLHGLTPWHEIAVALGVSSAIFAAGWIAFRRFERGVADVL